MKAIIVCISSNLKKLKETLYVFDEAKLVKNKNQFIYKIDMESVTWARFYISDSLINPHISDFILMNSIIDKRINEFNINGVNVSIRVGNEMECFIRYYNKLKETHV